VTLVAELRRRGVFGALIAYGVAAAGLLQVLDIVTHAMEAPPWTMRLIIWLAVLGLVVTFVVSWFFDLTRRGFVRTQAPSNRMRIPATPAPVGAFTDPPPSIAVGSTLAGRYQLERALGSGGMGQVFAALDTKLGRRVAVKVVTLVHDPGRVQRFEQEARAAGALEHPNLLSVYDLGEEHGVPFLVTELLEGRTLRGLVSAGPLEPEQVVGLALQLARGLGAAHARGVVHRDLKPENIFVTEDGRLKILDFGLAKLSSPDDSGPLPGLTATGAVFGTAGYLSPEQARGDRAGPASDVFAAGAVLYELLTGERAFPGASLVEAAHAAMKSEPPPLPGTVPPPLQSIVRRCLEKDPAKRFRDGGELAKAIETQPMAATVRAVDVTRPRRRHARAGLYAAAATLAVAAAAGSALLVRKSASRAAPWWAQEDKFVAAERKFRDSRQQGSKASRPPTPPLPANPNLEVPLPVVPDIPFFDPKSIPGVPQAAIRAGDWGLLTGARALWRADKKDRAEQLLRRSVERRPGFVPARLELIALLRRDGRAGEANGLLQGAAETLPKGNWYATLLEAWRGRASESAVLDAASRSESEDEDDDDKSQRVAEAEYYLGLLRATDSPPDFQRAQKDFEKSLDEDSDGPQASFAREELSSLQRALAGSGR